MSGIKFKNFEEPQVDFFFKNLFVGKNSDEVLVYLENFCAIYDATLAVNERIDCYVQGRRSVFLEIKKMINYEHNEQGEVNEYE